MHKPFAIIILLLLPFSALAVEGFRVYAQGQQSAYFEPDEGIVVAPTVTWQVGVCQGSVSKPVKLFADFATGANVSGAVLNGQFFKPSHPLVKDLLPSVISTKVTKWQADIYYAEYNLGTMTTRQQASSAQPGRCEEAVAIDDAQRTLNTLVANSESENSLSQLSLRNIRIISIEVPEDASLSLRQRYNDAINSVNDPQSTTQLAPALTPDQALAPTVAPLVTAEAGTTTQIQPNYLQHLPVSKHDLPAAKIGLAIKQYAYLLKGITVLQATDVAQRQHNIDLGSYLLAGASLAATDIAISRLPGDTVHSLGITTTGMNPWYHVSNGVFAGFELGRVHHFPSAFDVGFSIAGDVTMTMNTKGVEYTYVVGSSRITTGSSALHLSSSSAVGGWWLPNWALVERVSLTTKVISLNSFDDHNSVRIFSKPMGKGRIAERHIPIESLRTLVELENEWNFSLTMGVSSPRWGLGFSKDF